MKTQSPVILCLLFLCLLPPLSKAGDCHFDLNKKEKNQTLAPLIWEIHHQYDSAIQSGNYQELNVSKKLFNETLLFNFNYMPFPKFVNTLYSAFDLGLLCYEGSKRFFTLAKLKNRIRKGKIFEDLKNAQLALELKDKNQPETLVACPGEEHPFPAKEGRKPKVLILSSDGGGGHVSASKAITAFLGDGFEVSTIKPSDKYFDITLFDKLFSNENWFKLKHLVKMQPIAEEQLKYKVKGIEKDIMNEKPDVIVSVFPVANHIYRKIAAKHRIPMFLVPLEYNPYEYLRKLKRENNPASFQIILRVLDDKIKNMVGSKNLKSHQVMGAPLRKELSEFAQKYRQKNPEVLEDIKKLKEQYGMKGNDKLVIISLGAKSFGSEIIKQYIHSMDKNQDEVTQKGNHLHVMVAAGQNEEFLKELVGIQAELRGKNSKIILHPEGWLDAKAMGTRMAAQDVGIIKPGGNTTAEFMALGKRALFKSDSGRALPWENDNMKFFGSMNWGSSLAYTSRGKIQEKDFIKKLKSFLYEIDSETDSPVNNFGPQFKKSVENVLDFRAKYYR